MTFRAIRRIPATLLAVACLAVAPVASAQMAPSAPSGGQDHNAHHPEQKPEAKPGGGMMGRDGMMGGDMMRMMSMMSMMQDMMGMMSAQSGRMAAHVEGRIASLKAELKITDAQTPQWNRFADALRGVGKSMAAMHQQMMQAGDQAALRARLTAQEKMLSAHLNSIKAIEEALDPLYASLSDEQKKIADAIHIGPMGMM